MTKKEIRLIENLIRIAEMENFNSGDDTEKIKDRTKCYRDTYLVWPLKILLKSGKKELEPYSNDMDTAISLTR